MSEAPRELPASWTIAPLSELIGPEGIFVDGDWVESKDQDPEGEVRLIQLADIGDGEFRNRSARFLTAAKAAELRCTYLREGDLLVARMPDPLGRCCVFPLRQERSYVTVVDVCIVRPGSAALETRFLMYAINSLGVRSDIAALQSGSTRKRISRGNLATVGIPIAPLREQHRIVAKIEELFSELDKAVESLTLARAQLKTYRQALLKAAFEGKLTADWRAANSDKLDPPETLLARIRAEREARYKQALDDWQTALAEWRAGGEVGRKPGKPVRPEVQGNPEIPDDLVGKCHDQWLWVRLSDIAEVSGGLTKNPKRDKLPLRMKYLRVANVYADRLELDEITEIGVSDEEWASLKLVPGDILVVEGNGSVDQIGRVAVWSGEIENVGHQNHLIRVRLVKGMQSKFFLSFLMSPLGRELIIRQASSTSGLHTLSISKVSGLPIPVAHSAEQSLTLERLAAPFSQVEKQLEEVDASLARTNALRQCILKKAFSGQLVPQDPTDEPAAALLARLREEAPAPRIRRRKTA